MSTPIPDRLPADPPGNGSLGASGTPGIARGSGPTGAADPHGQGAPPSTAARNEFSAFLDDLAELARGSGSRDLRGELERRVSQARMRLAELYDSGIDLTVRTREHVQRGLDASRDAVADRPLSSVALAALAGLLVGLLLNRRR